MVLHLLAGVPNLASGTQFFGHTAGFEGHFGGMTPGGNPFGMSR